MLVSLPRARDQGRPARKDGWAHQPHLRRSCSGPIGPSHRTGRVLAPPHPRPRPTLIAYWWFRVRRTLISRTARPCRRISSATARGTRKSGTGETFIPSGEDVPVAAWPTVRSHFWSGLPPLVFDSVLLVSFCIQDISLHRDSPRRIHHRREPPVKRVRQWFRKRK